MKSILCYIFCMLQIYLFAQDTIYKRSGEIISVKVQEINIKEISYKRTDLLEGPLFIVPKNDIQKIKYQNGAIDTFSIVKQEPKLLLFNQSLTSPSSFNGIKKTTRRGVYIYKGHHISDRKVMKLLDDKNIIWNNLEIKDNLKFYKKNKLLQYAVGFGGVSLLGATLVGCAMTSESNTSTSNDVLTASIAAVGVGLFVSSQIVSFSFKLKAVKHSDKLADLFNTYPKK